jgi:hypothetical protein
MSDYGTKKTYTPKNFFDELEEHIGEKTGTSKKADPTNRQKLFNFISGKKFMETEFPDQEWLVDGVIPDKGLVCLSGMPSSYKSWFGFYLALCVMKGDAVLKQPISGFSGWETSKGAVLFIDKENIEKQIQERMKMLGAGEEMKNCYFLQGNFTTENLHSLAEVVEFIREKKIKLVVIDSLIRIHSRNENEAVEMNKVFEKLSELQHAGAAVIYLHHLRKATTYSQDPMERLRGSIDIAARLDSLVAFENSEKNIIKVSHGKSRYKQAFAPFIMRFEVDQHNKAFFHFDKELEPGQMERMLCVDAVYALIKENSHTRKHLLEKLSTINGGLYAERTIDDATHSLVSEGKIKTNRTGRGAEVIFTNNELYEKVHQVLIEEKKEIPM